MTLHRVYTLFLQGLLLGLLFSAGAEAQAPLSALETNILVLFAALPPASAAYILAARMGGDGRCVATAVSAGTVFSVLTIPFWLFIGQKLVN